jgi:C4-dicarboxylate transporter DctQ subunit
LPEFIYGPDERLPRWVAYLMLPIGLVLFVFRCTQALYAIIKGDRELIIASHEAEELIENNRNIVAD